MTALSTSLKYARHACTYLIDPLALPLERHPDQGARTSLTPSPSHLSGIPTREKAISQKYRTVVILPEVWITCGVWNVGCETIPTNNLASYLPPLTIPAPQTHEYIVHTYPWQ